MTRELVANRLADGSRAATVDHAHLGPARERGGVDKSAHHLARLLRCAPTQIDLAGKVVLNHGPDGHRRRGRLVVLHGVVIGAKAIEGHAHPEAAAAEHGRLVAGDLRDRASYPERRRNDRVAGREWSRRWQRRVEPRQRLLCACRAV